MLNNALEALDTTAEMDIHITPDGGAEWNGRRLVCAIGRGRLTRDKREGDGATPVGSFPLRQVLYRADRLARPETLLPARALHPLDAWCDAPDDPGYNRLVRQPHGASFELMWRADHLYDLVVVVGYNDDPVVPGRGSAIFLHLARDDFSPTEGCVAFGRETLLKILAECDADTRLTVSDT